MWFNFFRGGKETPTKNREPEMMSYDPFADETEADEFEDELAARQAANEEGDAEDEF